MKKLLSAALLTLSALTVLPLASCTPTAPEFSPNGPVSSESSLSWNRPTGPEGGGALGGALQ